MTEYKLDHIALGMSDAASARPFVVGVLGAHELGGGGGGPEHRYWQWSFAGGGVLEIVEPIGPPGGFLHRFLAARGPGPHHLTFKVPDIHDAMARARAAGYEIVSFSDADPYWIEAFLHPKQAQGIVVQLAETRPKPGPPKPRTEIPETLPVTLVGVRLAARSAERARAQWEKVLLGTCDVDGVELVFRWPGSPLRLAVEIDPAGPEGVRAIEIAAPHPLALPEGPHPDLGVSFVEVAST